MADTTLQDRSSSAMISAVRTCAATPASIASVTRSVWWTGPKLSNIKWSEIAAA